MTNQFPGAEKTFDFGSPVRLHFGEGLIDRFRDFCPEARQILVVSGRSSAIKSGLVDRVVAALPGKQVALFSEVEPNPSIETIERGAALARSLQADLVVGIGGGSALDAAKCIAVLGSNAEGFRALLGRQVYASRPIRMLAVPTTCGTGSEANRYAIITDLQSADKVTFEGPHTYPSAGILDPSVLAAIPAGILVDTACDAFTHAFEGYTSRRSQPFSDTLAVEAMALIIGNLPAARDGRADAKASLLYAASLAGIVIDHTATTMLHAMGYYLTLRHGVPHGRANAVFLPVLLSYLERQCPEKLDRVYGMFPPDARGADGVKRYLSRLGIEASPSACGMRRSEAEQFADYVLGKKNTARTVGTVTRETLLELLDGPFGLP